jgi:hypothetical protein
LTQRIRQLLNVPDEQQEGSTNRDDVVQEAVDEPRADVLANNERADGDASSAEDGNYSK